MKWQVSFTRSNVRVRQVQELMLCLIDYKFGISLAKVIKLGEENSRGFTSTRSM